MPFLPPLTTTGTNLTSHYNAGSQYLLPKSYGLIVVILSEYPYLPSIAHLVFEYQLFSCLCETKLQEYPPPCLLYFEFDLDVLEGV